MKIVKAGAPFFIMIFLALLLSAFLFYPLISRGMEINTDSVKYLKTATYVVEGYGFSLGCAPNVHPNRHWPPGYSVLIAAFLIFDIHWILSCKIIALACYFLLLTGISFYVYRITGSLALALLSEAATGFHPNILRYGGAILSEPLSWLFLLGITATLTALIINPQKRWAVALGFMLGLSMLVRYAYIPLGVICVVLFLLLCFGTPWPKRIRLAILICLPATLVFGSWMIRNLLVFGKMARSRPPFGTLSRNSWDGLNSWFEVLFQTRDRSLQPLLWVVLVVLGIFALRALYRRTEWQTARPDLALPVNLFLAVGYTLGLVLLKTYRTALALNDRKFTQIILLFVLILATAAAVRYSKYIRRICLSLFVLFCVWSVFLGISAIPELSNRWLGYFEFKSSPTMMYVINGGVKPRSIYTSDPEAFWLWQRKCPRSLPNRSQRAQASYFQKRGARMLVWFKRSERRTIARPENVEWDIPTQMKEFNDGFVYHLRRNGKRATPAPSEPNDFPEYPDEQEED